MDKLDKLKELLKKKGIGPAGSKSLDMEQSVEAEMYLMDEDLNLTTRLTLLTALLSLEKNDHEVQLLKNLKKKSNDLSPLLQRMINQEASGRFEEIIYKTINHNHLQKNEASEAIDLFFDESIQAPLKAAFLEAQRLKRETTEENLAFLNSFWYRTNREETKKTVIIDFCNNYDGWSRTLNYSTFTAMYLAELGVSVSMHGLDCVAPKMGYTTENILNLLEGCRFPKEFHYHSQKDFFPTLYQMKQMREDMVKRPFLATIERLLQPLRAENGNMMIIGYTHKAYREEFAKLMKLQNMCSSALILKGEEGSTQLPLDKPTSYIKLIENRLIENEISPEEFDIIAIEKPRYPIINEKVLIDSITNHDTRDYAIAVVEYNAKALSKIFDLNLNITREGINLFFEKIF